MYPVPKFIIELRCWQKDKDKVSTLMGKFQFGPDNVKLTYKTGLVDAMFYYNKLSHARETIVYLWDVLLDGGGGMSFMPPRLIVQKNENENENENDDEEELNIRLSVLFKERIIRFMEEKKILSRNVREKELFREFKSAMECILDHLDDGAFDDSCGLKVLRLKGGATCDWNKILLMVKRECRRLHDALPIYAHRTHILSQIHRQQVVVLAGEVGSGKSAQLAQFLVDSGVAGDKSIVCTLPCKLAAMSSALCEDNSVSVSSAYSSFQQSDSKVIYMTDHCLLQHYMNDDNFSRASCVIVDKAQERSLNTDLLLALMKDLLCRRSDLRLIIMSATEDAQLSKYFYGCSSYHVVGGTFPADVRDVPEPEIRRVNLGILVLRMLSLGVHKIKEFDLIDAPSNAAIEAAIKSLIQLGAIVLEEDGVHKLTKDGRMLVKLGIEPRLGKMILKCFENRLGREGLVLAAVMANSSSIFRRRGTEDEKQESDCLKVQFCHPSGDLFTLLSVYKNWECTPTSKRNQWCWDNSVNARSMRRCQKAVKEMESRLQHELNIIIPASWCWDPLVITGYDKILKDVILSALVDNIAMYSGNDTLGYEVASTGTYVQLHPSCSLQFFEGSPRWVVFGEIIAKPNRYLVCVTSIDFDSLQTLSPAPFDISQIQRRQL